MTEHSAESGDILGRREIEALVDAFYTAVRKDTALGPVFDQVAKVDWREHLPKICDFWETVLFRTGGYRGSPLAVHLKLALETRMDRPMFDRWLELFKAAADRLFSGPNTEHIKAVAADMAQVIHSRLREASMFRPPAFPL
jgi:hemoglobin